MLAHEGQKVEPACSITGMPFCRDALAVLRRQYGLEASPRKKNHQHPDLKAQDAPALEQVRIAEFPEASATPSTCKFDADYCGGSAIHPSTVSATNHSCLLRACLATAHSCFGSLLGAGDSCSAQSNSPTVHSMVLGCQTWDAAR